MGFMKLMQKLLQLSISRISRISRDKAASGVDKKSSGQLFVRWLLPEQQWVGCLLQCACVPCYVEGVDALIETLGHSIYPWVYLRGLGEG